MAVNDAQGAAAVMGAAATHDEEIANNSSINSNVDGGRGPIVYDLQNAMAGPSTHHEGNGSHLVDGEGNGGRLPAYKGIVRSESISFKITHPCPQNATEMEQLSRDIGKEVEKLYRRRLRHSRKLVLARSATVPGCILNITEIFAPYSVSLYSDPLDLVRCLPVFLRRKRIEVVTSHYHATVEKFQLIKLVVHENRRTYNVQCERRTTLPTLCLGPRVQYVEPPCLVHDDTSEQCIRIGLDKNPTQISPLRVVTELKGRVVDDQRTTQESLHDVNLVLRCVDCNTCGSVRLVHHREDNVPNVSPLSMFAILPPEAAKEFNFLYSRCVQSHQQSVKNSSMDARSIVQASVIQPVLADLNYILSANSSSGDVESKIAGCASVVVDSLLNFFREEGLPHCLNFLKRHIITRGTDPNVNHICANSSGDQKNSPQCGYRNMSAGETHEHPWMHDMWTVPKTCSNDRYGIRFPRCDGSWLCEQAGWSLSVEGQNV